MWRYIFKALIIGGLIYTVVTGSLFKVAAVLFALSLILFVHELGHFLAAKLMGTPVEEFSIGMGSTVLWQREIGETLFVLRALPIGAYVKMEDDLDEPERYVAKKLPPRVIILLAGSVFNILLAFSLTSSRLYLCGQRPTSLKLQTVDEARPAYAAGLRPGDEITQIGGVPVTSSYQVLNSIRESGGQPLQLQVTRGQERVNCQLIPASTPTGGSAGFTGVPVFLAGPSKVFSLGQSISKGLSATIKQALFTAQMAYMLIGKIFQSGTMPKGVGGPVKVAQVAWSANSLEQFVAITASLSVSIGVFNMLPLPLLDGGRIIVAFIAWLFGLFLSILKWEEETKFQSLQKFEMSMNLVGLVGLALLFFLASYNDLANLFC